MKTRWIAFFYASLLLCTTAAERGPVEIAPTHSAIRYVGRFTDDHRFGWTGSKIEVEFKGTSVHGVLELTAGDAAGLAVVVDGKETFLKLRPGRQSYPLAEGLSPNQRHRIVLFKRSEGTLGEVRFFGFQLSDDAQLLKPKPFGRTILAVGDSITCGYGNEAASLEEGNTVENENGYLSYAAIAARKLDADLMMVCWSGRGMFRNYGDSPETLPSCFDRILPMKKEPTWNQNRFVPDVVVINLGTNDMNTRNDAREPLEKADYIAAYKAFLSRMRTFSPDSKIILSIGPMADEPVSHWLPEIAEGFENTSVLIYTSLSGSEDLGGHWHPSVKKHRAMAKELIAEIKKTTDWK